MKNKNVIRSIMAFCSLLVISIVYAYNLEDIVMEGYIARSMYVELQFSNVYIDTVNCYPVINPGRESVNVTSTNTVSNQELHIALDLSEPGAYREIRFKVQNSGTLAAKLDSWIINELPDPVTSGIDIIWPNLNDVTLNPGTTSDEYVIRFWWDDAHYSNISQGYRSFKASINYHQLNK